MNQLQAFQNVEYGEVRTILRDGEPWFVAADVCRALEIGNPTMALSRLDEDEQALISIEGLSRGNETGNIVNEPGLYTLVLGSRKKEAKNFKRWITHDVIPAIRKNGYYGTRPVPQSELILMMAQDNVERDKRIDALDKRTDEVDRKVTDAVAVFSVPTLAKDGWQHKMNAIISALCEQHGLSHQRTRGELYEELEQAAGVNLASRQTRMRTRLRKNGATCREAQAVTKLHIIAQDPKLRAIYEGIVRQRTAQKLVG